MLSQTTDASFAGSLPAFYQQYLVPLIFEPYAADLARRLARRPLRRVLEIAAGTGVVTRRLASTLPESVAIVATDLNQAMLDQAAATGTSRPVEWRQADASALPFPDQSVDAVVCQFGVMFFPDKPRAFAEARRVLRPAGVFLFNVWDRIEDDEFADVITAELATLCPDGPPQFLIRPPHGYADRATIERDLSAAGFGSPAEFVTLAGPSRADSADIPALAYCHGTPLRN
jgi:SAM-dependent methyltransferase